MGSKPDTSSTPSACGTSVSPLAPGKKRIVWLPGPGSINWSCPVMLMMFGSTKAAGTPVVAMAEGGPEMYVVVEFVAAVTDASFSDTPSTPLTTDSAALTNAPGRGDVSPRLATAVRVVKSFATAILFSTSTASVPVAPFAIANAAAPG